MVVRGVPLLVLFATLLFGISAPPFIFAGLCEPSERPWLGAAYSDQATAAVY